MSITDTHQLACPMGSTRLPSCQGSDLGLQPSWNAREGEVPPGKGQVNEPTASNTLIHLRPQPIIRISIRIRIMSMPSTGNKIAA